MQKPDGILKTLCCAGHEAYYVGGCVRDTLLGRPVHDWDITTSAKPEEIMALFDRCVPTGIAHGTVTVLLGDSQAEVTTFRTDGAYLDSRRPESVRFVSSLHEDLIRRDFTVNAMAMDADGNLIDDCGGKEDLRRRLIRCVGDAETRFSEDALRMLRALRFSAQLDFTIEEKTMQAIGKEAALCEKLSAERVRDECEKTLFSPKPQTLQTMITLGLLRAVGITACEELSSLAALPPTNARWARLRQLCPQFSPKTMRLPAKLCAQIEHAAAWKLTEPAVLCLKRAAAKYGVPTAQTIAELAGEESLFSEILESGECISLSALAVGGNDLPWFSGSEVGAALQRLLEHVLEHPEDNQKEILLEMAKK